MRVDDTWIRHVSQPLALFEQFTLTGHVPVAAELNSLAR